ncbi:MAG: DUF1653 domain-containing protein [Candidatus Magasanikbacteria bacterium]|nr:DUF1653 domain-containing protein [Candidatus Magasanikbacteria bacterium]
MSEVKTGIYEHYKGKRYQVIDEATESDSDETMVVYRGLYDDPKLGHHPLFVRSKKIFLEEVEVGGKRIPRFKFISTK